MGRPLARALLAVVSVVLLVVAHEADATSDLGGAGEVHSSTHSTQVVDLGEGHAPAGVGTHAFRKDRGNSDLETEHAIAQQLKTVSNMDNMMASVDAVEKEAEEAREAESSGHAANDVAELVPGQIETIGKDIRDAVKRTGIEQTMNAEEKARLEAFEGKTAKGIAADENGIPKHIIRAVLQDPDYAAAKYGGTSKGADGSTEFEQRTQNSEEQFTERPGEGKEEYFVRVLRTKAQEAGLVFQSKHAADDYYMDTAADLVRSELGVGFKSSLKNATVLIAQKQIQMITDRILAGRERLVAVQADVQKEIKKKSVAGKLALQYNNIKRAAEKKEADVQSNKEELRSWSKQASTMEFKITELQDEIKANKKALATATEKTTATESALAGARTGKSTADTAEVSAKAALDEANANAMSATGATALAEKTGQMNAAKRVYKSAQQSVAGAESVLEQADAEDRAAAAAVLLSSTKASALEQQLTKVQADHKKAVAYQTMYKEKAESAQHAAVDGEDALGGVEKSFVEEVVASVHNSKILHIHSATYMCPNQIDPTSKLKIPDEKTLALVEGNQNENLMKSCEGQTSCKYMIYPVILGEAAPDCSEYTYTVKYSCEVGSIERPTPPSEVTNTTTSGDDGSSDVFLQESASYGAFIGSSKAQAEDEAMRSDMGLIKEELKEEAAAKKQPTADIDDLATTDAIKQLKINLNKAEPADTLGLHSYKKTAQPIETVALPPGAGDRAISLVCVQEQDPKLMQAESEVDRLKAALADAKKSLTDEADKEEDKLEGAIAKDKVESENDSAQVADATAQVQIDKDELTRLKGGMKTLQDRLATATDANKASVQLEIDNALTQIATLQAKLPVEGATKAAASAAASAAQSALDNAKAALKTPAHTELATPLEIQNANRDVKTAESNLEEQKIVVNKLMDMLVGQTESATIVTIDNHLLNQSNIKSSMETKVLDERRHRDEVILGVSNELQTKSNSRMVEAEEKETKNQVNIDALKMKMENVTSPAQHTKLKEELDQAEKLAAQDKMAGMQAASAPALSEASVVSKLEKKELLSQKQHELTEQEEKDKITKAEEADATEKLKNARSPDEVAAGIMEVSKFKKEESDDEKETARKTQEVTNALAIEAQPGSALVNEARGTVETARADVKNIQKKIRDVQDSIDKSSDPSQVETLTDKKAKYNLDLVDAKQTVIRRAGKLEEIGNTVAAEGPNPEKPVNKMEMLEHGDPILGQLEERVALVAAKLQAANAGFAGVINGLLSTKENSMKAAEKHSRNRLNLDESDLDDAKVRFVQSKQRLHLDHKLSNDFENIRNSVMKGHMDFAHDLAAKRSQMAPTPRTSAERAEALEALRPIAPNSGVCAKGDCCLTSYMDDSCDVPHSKMCKWTQENEDLDWQNLVTVDTTMKTLVEGEAQPRTAEVNKTIHLKTKWVKESTGHMSLDVQICGRMTKYGSTGGSVCFPKAPAGGNKGLKIGNLFTVNKATCVRTADFVDVIRSRVTVQAQRYIDDHHRLEKLKAESRSKSHLEEITEAVSRAIGGAFKGSMAGVDGAEEMTHLDFLAFIDEATREDWEQLLTTQGSFKITQIATARDFATPAPAPAVTEPASVDVAGGATDAAPAQPEVREVEQL